MVKRYVATIGFLATFVFCWSATSVGAQEIGAFYGGFIASGIVPVMPTVYGPQLTAGGRAFAANTDKSVYETGEIVTVTGDMWHSLLDNYGVLKIPAGEICRMYDGSVPDPYGVYHLYGQTCIGSKSFPAPSTPGTYSIPVEACGGWRAGAYVAMEDECDSFTFNYAVIPSTTVDVIMTGTFTVASLPSTWWDRIIASVTRWFITPTLVQASGPAVDMTFGDIAVMHWTSTGAAQCQLTIPSNPPAVVPINSPAEGYAIPGLPAGTHNIDIACTNAAGTLTDTDTVTVNVTANELRICPSSLTMGMGTVYQMRAFYLIGGVDCNSTGPAQDVSNLVTWTSSNPLIATVGNSLSGGRVNAQFTLGTTDITISSYLGKTAPPSTVTVVGGYAICPASASTYSGGTTQLEAYYSALTPIDCSNLTGATNVTGSVTWSSANNGIATVVAGLVTGVSSGAVDISVSPYNKVNALPVTVTISGGYRICPASANVGSTGFSFHSYYNPAGSVDCGNLAGTSDVTGSVTWSSSDPGVATIGNGGSAGVAMPVGLGSSNISTTPYSGIPSGTAVATVTCIPSVTCASPGPAATAANNCPNKSFTIDDGCGFLVTCPGTRTCDFNWKEVGQ